MPKYTKRERYLFPDHLRPVKCAYTLCASGLIVWYLIVMTEFSTEKDRCYILNSLQYIVTHNQFYMYFHIYNLHSTLISTQITSGDPYRTLRISH